MSYAVRLSIYLGVLGFPAVSVAYRTSGRVVEIVVAVLANDGLQRDYVTGGALKGGHIRVETLEFVRSGFCGNSSLVFRCVSEV